MADQLLGAEGLGRPRRKWRHDWHPYEDYLTVHAEHLTALIDAGKVLRNGLGIVETRDGRELVKVNIRGRIECDIDVVILIDKWLDVRRGRQRRYEVRGSSYSYHAWLRSSGQTLLRYDTAHGLEDLHRHQIASSTESTEPIALEDLPTLTDFVEEALIIASELISPPS